MTHFNNGFAKKCELKAVFYANIPHSNSTDIKFLASTLVKVITDSVALLQLYVEVV